MLFQAFPDRRIHRQGFSRGKFLAFLFAAFAGWAVVAWFLAEQRQSELAAATLAEEHQHLQMRLEDASFGIQRSLALMHGIPSTLVLDTDIRQALKRPIADDVQGARGVSEKRRQLEKRRDLELLDQRLAAAVENLGVISVLWLMNDQGDCIAASNAGRTESFVGINYADRKYFRDAMDGRLGNQFAVGRATNIPGLFFSAPVVVDGRSVGVVAAKVDMPFIALWVRQAKALLVDEYGVIIAAYRDAYEMQAMPRAAIHGLDAAQRSSRYKREQFAELALSSWGDARFPELMRVGDEAVPHLVDSMAVPGQELTLTVIHPVPRVAAYDRDRYNLFLLLAAMGELLIAVIGGGIYHIINIRRTREALSVSEYQLRSIIEMEPECVCMLSSAGVIRQMNRAGLEMFEAEDSGQVVGQPLARFVQGDQGCVERMIGQVLESGLHSMEFQVGGLRGGTCWLEMYAVPLRDAAGAGIGLLGVARDVTRRKEAENALRDLNATLERRVEEEVAMNMEQERLLMQQARHATMGEMIGNIAHQWRQPLSALGLVLQNMAIDYREGTLDEKAMQAYKEQGMRLVNKMSSTIDDFRNFFRPDKLVEPFSLRQCAKDTLELMQGTLDNHGIVVHVDDSQDAVVEGYPNEFSQILLNLLTNAKDALIERRVQNGRIEIRIAADHHQARIWVRDNAGGIPVEIAERIFDPYFTTKENGTGVGLYMARMIVRRSMAGHIRFHNVEDGAEFVVSLPLSRKDHRAASGEGE